MGRDIGLLYVEGGMFVHPSQDLTISTKKTGNKSQYVERSENGDNSKL